MGVAQTAPCLLLQYIVLQNITKTPAIKRCLSASVQKKTMLKCCKKKKITKNCNRLNNETPR